MTENKNVKKSLNKSKHKPRAKKEDKFDNRIELTIDNSKSKYTSQSEALLQLILGNNVFLSGPAGSGKSFVIRKYCKILRSIDPDVNIYRTSTTGLSALNIQGETIHSYSGQGVSSKSYSEFKEDHSAFEGLWQKSLRKIRDTDVLIIDEISMFSEAQMKFLRERMEDVLRRKLNHTQIIVAGDFSQLQPVATRQQIRDFGPELANYCYGTGVWNKFNFVNCYLDRIYRAKDTRLQELLDLISTGHGSDPRAIEILRSIKTRRESHIPGVPTLLPTNREVSATNKRWQDANNGQEYYSYTHYDNTHEIKLAHKMAKERDVEEELRIKAGDTVMITTNDNENDPYAQAVNGGPTLKNGMIGQFIGMMGEAKSDSPEPARRLPLNAKLKFVYKFEVDGIEKEFLYLISQYHETILNSHDIMVAGFTQYPLKLAYAISIHKSQGQTFSNIAVNLSRSWAPGLGYVALSRATNISGIMLIDEYGSGTPWNATALQIDHTSMLIKQSLMVRSRKLRKQYERFYPVAAYDIFYIIKNRKRKKLNTLLIDAHARMVKDKSSDKPSKPKIKIK